MRQTAIYVSPFFRHVQFGTKMRKTVVPSDSGYLTTEGSEKTIGDVRESIFYYYLYLLLYFLG
jgi:hypothetical protein